MTSQRDETHAEAAVQVAAVVDLLARRYGIREDEIPDLLESARWVREHRALLRKIQTAGMLTTLSLIVTALAAALWEGIRSMIRNPS
jgi:hypothetical protein